MQIPYDGHTPDLDADVFVAPTAVLVGQVKAGSGCSIWFNAVLRGDNDSITLGQRTNIQDGCILHVDRGHPLEIGDDCVVGHAAVLHGCTLRDRVLVGIGARILNSVLVEEDVVIAAGTLVPEGVRLESGYLYLGIPARQIRPLRPEERERIKKGAQLYVERGRNYRIILQG